jgi:hypothetical protein
LMTKHTAWRHSSNACAKKVLKISPCPLPEQLPPNVLVDQPIVVGQQIILRQRLVLGDGDAFECAQALEAGQKWQQRLVLLIEKAAVRRPAGAREYLKLLVPVM